MKITKKERLTGFADNLRFLMKQAGDTQQMLADCVGVTRQAVAMWQNGSTEPNLKCLCKIAERYNVTTDSLLGFTGGADCVVCKRAKEDAERYINLLLSVRDEISEAVKA